MTVLKPFRLTAFLLILWCCVAACFSAQAPQPLRIHVGDILSVHLANSDKPDEKYTVLSDGTISGHLFGSVKVEGLTIEQVNAAVKHSLEKKLVDPAVSVVLELEFPHTVYLSGTRNLTGEIKLLPGMDVRRLLASADLGADPDLFEAHLFRGGNKEQKASVRDILSGASPLAEVKLQGNDVVAILPYSSIRVWVTGEIVKPGQILLKPDDNIYRAIAEAGGVAGSAVYSKDSKILLRRGPSSFTFPLHEDPSSAPMALEAGDTVVVEGPELISVTVSGEVRQPGKVPLSVNSVLDEAVAGAGGLTPAGTGREVTVLRDGKSLTANVGSGTSSEGLGSFKIQDRDVVLVKQNTRFAIVVGQIRNSGRVYLPDGITLRLIDAIVAAGGIGDRGSSRHVIVAHPDASGKFAIKSYRLDKFLKDGDLAGNPVINPGDIITVGSGQPTSFEFIQQALSSAVLLYGVSKL